MIVNNWVGGTKKSDLARLGRAETTNMFVEITDNEYAVNTVLVGMPGWESKYSIAGGTPRGIHRCINGKVFYAVGNELFCDGVKIINIAAGDSVSMCETGGHNPYLLVVDGTSMFAININDSIIDMQMNYKTIEVPNDPWESTAETAVPGKPIGIAMIYEHPMLLLKNTDRIYMGYQYPWEWTPSEYYKGETEISNFNPDDIFMLHWKDSQGNEMFPEGKWISSDYSSDIANSIVSSKGKLYVAGPKAIQAFSYIGGDFVAGDVFSCNEASCARVGAYDNSLIDIAGSYCFVGDDGVFVDGQCVSDSFVDEAIKGKYLHVGSLGWNKHKLYVIYLTDQTIAYDLYSHTWINLSSLNRGQMSKFRYDYCSEDLALCGTAVVQLSKNTYKEHDGTPIVKRRRGGIMMREATEMQIDRLKFISNNGQFNGNATLNVYVNGVLSESNIVDFSTLGDYSSPFEWYDLGNGYTFEVELLCDTDSPLSFNMLDVDAKECVC